MKVVILAGGYGTRISEETVLKPKPMIEIGGKPILWHVMKLYSHYGFNDFIVCLGYKGEVIKKYFADYGLHNSDVTFNFKTNSIYHHKCDAEPWNVTLVDTGLHTLTAGRILRVKEYIGNESFMLTYGDGVADVDIKALVDYHKKHGKKATVTAIVPKVRFGALKLSDDFMVKSFEEKPEGGGSWINGGFFVLEPDVFDYIKDGDKTIWERAPMQALSKEGELVAFQHKGFWKCMDHLRDKKELEALYSSPECPWALWEK